MSYQFIRKGGIYYAYVNDSYYGTICKDEYGHVVASFQGINKTCKSVEEGKKWLIRKAEEFL